MKKPTIFGKYLLLERVNVGGMAEVFIAKAFGVEGFERILAIKKILPTMAEDDEFITMFIDEARISVQLNHANVVHIHELGKHDETYFIAMEYVPGRDLRTLQERYRRRKEIMPTAQAVFIASKMCEGLDYAHRKKDARGQDLQIIHRDVSPQNILISYEGEVKIIDFGIAKAANRSQKTQAGILKGKFGYMSPEQVRGMPIDRRSDIFAVGVILYEMLTGEKLFVGESDFSTLEKVRNAEVPMPRQFNPNIPAGLEKVLLKALAREPEDRYQWGSDLQEDLMRFLLAGDAIYSAKHLSAYMKDAFAEDILREAEKMERYASISRPDQLESSGVTAQPAPRRPAPQPPAAPPAPTLPPGRAPTAPAQPAAGYIPPPTAEELAELDGAGDKTQIVDSANGLSGVAGSGGVLFDDSATGKVGIPEEPSPAARPAGKSGPKAPVVIGAQGEEEPPVGATMVGPAPDDEPPPPPRAQAARPKPRPAPQPVQEEPASEESELPPEDEQQAADDYPEDEQHPEDEQEATVGLRPGGRNKPAAPVKQPKAQGKGKGKVPARVDTGKPNKLKPILMGVAAVVLLSLAGVAAILLSGPGKGAVMVSVEPSTGAQVQIDGQAVAPNSVVELPEGQHQVTASAPGFKPRQETVTVVAGQTPVVALKLEPLSKAAARNEPAQEEPKAPVAETPKEPANEEKQPAETPREEEPAVAVNDPKPEEPKPTEEPKPEEPAKPEKFTALFAGESGVEIVVDGKSVGKTPNARLADLKVGKTYRFTAKRAGFKPFSGKFSSSGEPEVEVAFELEPEPEPEPAPRPPREEKQPRTVREEPKPQPPPRPAKEVKLGKFACSTKPAGAQIWVDGKNTGRETPVALGNPLMLPVGQRKIVFKLDGKATKAQMVSVTEDGVAKLVNVPIE
jgi:serine/threonine protein kinase